ncbi:MAG TPA: SLBB domain-containing protein, partial [Candidatus Limnocylindria bacterium]|nr:SLBB domain-containing protein [Candidatus Limnocylindria bacterium]
PPSPPGRGGERMSLTVRDRIALGLAGCAAACVVAAGWLLVAAPTSAGGLLGSSSLPPLPTMSTVAVGSPPPGGELVVDVQGGVVRPGVVVLPGGSRVADAIEAAGGFADTADTIAAAGALNLAAPLTDGAQVYVPLKGVAGASHPPAGPAGPGGGNGLVNLNSATPEELDALPGIGPVTVQKIVAARAERAFTTLDELVERDVMNRGQLDGIRDLVTI